MTDSKDPHSDGADGADSPRSGSGGRRRRLRAGDADREAVLEVLSSAHAAGRLDPDEIDARQNAVLRCTHIDQLPEHIDDLPEGARLAAELTAQAEAASGTGGSASAGSALSRRTAARAPARPGEILPAEAGPGDDRTNIAILGGSEFFVEPGTPRVLSYALMGGSEIYLSDVLGPGIQVTVETYAMWAGNEIFVPGGVKVVDETVNVMAGNEIAKHARGDGSNGVLVLRGFSLMAGNEVRLDPNWAPPAGQLEQ